MGGSKLVAGNFVRYYAFVLGPGKKKLGTKPDNFLLLNCGSGSCYLHAIAFL